MIVLLALTFSIGPAPRSAVDRVPVELLAAMGGRRKPRFSCCKNRDIGWSAGRNHQRIFPATPTGACADFGRADAKAGRRASARRFADLFPAADACWRWAPTRRIWLRTWMPRPRRNGTRNRKPIRRSLPSPITRDAPEISMVAPDTFTSSTHPWLALYGKEDEVAALSYPVGQRRGHLVGFGVALDERLDTRQEQSGIFLELRRAAIGCARVLG